MFTIFIKIIVDNLKSLIANIHVITLFNIIYLTLIIINIPIIIMLAYVTV